MSFAQINRLTFVASVAYFLAFVAYDACAELDAHHNRRSLVAPVDVLVTCLAAVSASG